MAIITTKRRSMSPARRRRIFTAHASVCGWCHEAIGEGEAYEIDHAVPLWFGGADDDGPNAYPIHEGCHKRKTYGSRQATGRRADVSSIAKTKRLRARRLGLGRGQAIPSDRSPLAPPGGRHRGLARAASPSQHWRDEMSRTIFVTRHPGAVE